MKTTIDIHDVLLERAKRYAKDKDMTLRAVVEEGIHRVLETPEPPPFKLQDGSVGNPDGPNPFERYSFQEMLDMFYEGR